MRLRSAQTELACTAAIAADCAGEFKLANAGFARYRIPERLDVYQDKQGGTAESILRP
jgi:hypothetical protein